MGRLAPTVIGGSLVVTPAGVVADHEVVCVDGRITEVRPATASIDAAMVAPGFIDLQVNGHADVDVAAWADAMGRGGGTAEGEELARRLAAQGVTTWCPTLIGAPLDVLADRVDVLTRWSPDAGMPVAAGVHLEGPYLGGRPGAHGFVADGPIDRGWLADVAPGLAVVTLGPERPDAVAAIETLVGTGTVAALGHTAADPARVRAAADAGATLFTHGFNATGPLSARRPGPMGAALTDDRLVVSVIADGVHLAPEVLELVRRAKGPDGVALVTDAVAWRSGRLGEAGIDHVDGAPRRADGTLAGSSLCMHDAVRNAIGAGFAPAAAVAAASTTPARLLGLPDRGRIEVGARADLVALDHHGEVVGTWVAGHPAPGAGSPR